MPLEKMECGVNYTTELIRSNLNQLIDINQGALYLSSFTVGSASPLQDAVTQMNALKRPLVIDMDIEENNVTSTGYTVIKGNGHTISQANEAGRGFNVELKGENLGTYASVENVALGGQLINVTQVNGNFNVEVGDIVRIVDDATIDSNANTRHAEMAQVREVTGTYILLDCLLRHFNYYTTGTVFKVSKEKVIIDDVDFTPSDNPSTEIVRIASLTVAGAFKPKIRTTSNNDYSTGVALRGCYIPMVDYVGSNLRNDDSILALGYGVVAYSSTKGAIVSSNVTSGRTAYDDGIWANTDLSMDFDFGCTLDSFVTGTGYATGGATWDTHPYSDRTTFFNTRATGSALNASGDTSNAFGYKIRGTNVNIINGFNDRRFTLSIGNTSTMLIDSVNNVQINEPEYDENQTVSSSKISYEANESLNKLEVNIINSRIGGGWFSSSLSGDLGYLRFFNTTLDFGGDRPQSSSTKEYNIEFNNCIIKNFLFMRCSEKTTLKFIDSKITSLDPAKGPIDLYEGGNLTIINTGFDSPVIANGICKGIGTLTSATKIFASNIYSLSQTNPQISIGSNIANVDIQDISASLTPIS